MRTKIVAGNWKMNMDYFEGLNLFNDMIALINQEVTGKQHAVICSPFIHLHALTKELTNEKVSIGAQNAHQAEAGAYTGEVSAKMIASVGATHVILGHSERRQYFAEDGKLLTQKIDAALAHDLTPIYCIGETLKEREAHHHFDVIKKQLTESVFHLSATDFGRIILAYEPVWAIGTGVTASADQAQEIHAFIRKEIAHKYSQAVADGITILYGGSCNTKNAAELFAKEDIDGGLIGGASLKARDFVDILKVFN